LQQLTVFQFLSRSIILLIFIGLFLVDSFAYWVLEMNPVTIELCDFSNSESEKEEKQEETYAI